MYRKQGRGHESERKGNQMNSSTERDEAGIRRATNLYSVGADLRDRGMWTRAFTQDCVLEGPGFRTEGLEATLANLDHLEQYFPHTQHRLHSQSHVIEGDRAVGVSYATADQVTMTNGRAELLAWSLRYIDELVRDGAEWRFKSRKLLVDWEEIRPLNRVRQGDELAMVARPLEDERITVAQTVYKYATGIDNRDWAIFRSIFADEVEMDFASWNEIPRHSIRADELRDNCQVFFAGLDATQHSMSNPTVTIDGNRARCVVYMQAEHFLQDQDPGRRYVIGGYYTDDLERGNDGIWRLTAVKLTLLWEAGDRSFMNDAVARGLARLEGA